DALHGQRRLGLGLGPEAVRHQPQRADQPAEAARRLRPRHQRGGSRGLRWGAKPTGCGPWVEVPDTSPPAAARGLGTTPPPHPLPPPRRPQTASASTAASPRFRPAPPPRGLVSPGASAALASAARPASPRWPPPG